MHTGSIYAELRAGSFLCYFVGQEFLAYLPWLTDFKSRTAIKKRYNNGVETPPAHWSLKLLVVVLLLCSLIFIAAVVCSPPKNNSLASGNRSTFADIILTKEIELLNKGLPKMVDEETRWDNVKIQDGDIYYNYTLINYLASDLDIATFTGIMEPQIKNEDCNDKEVRPLIDAGRKLIFSYVDKTNKEIAQIIIDKSKCLPEASN